MIWKTGSGNARGNVLDWRKFTHTW